MWIVGTTTHKKLFCFWGVFFKVSHTVQPYWMDWFSFYERVFKKIIHCSETFTIKLASYQNPSQSPHHFNQCYMAHSALLGDITWLLQKCKPNTSQNRDSAEKNLCRLFYGRYLSLIYEVYGMTSENISRFSNDLFDQWYNLSMWKVNSLQIYAHNV